MKKMFLSLFLLLFTIVVFADNYQVNVNSELNVRNEPSKEGWVIAKLKKNTVIEATILENGWAMLTINGETGYVDSKYLNKISGGIIHTKRKSRWDSIFNWGDANYKWLVYPIIGLILLIWFFCKFIRGLKISDNYFWDNNNLKGNLAIISASIQILCSITIFIYVWKAGQYALWFIMPSSVGWGYAILNFIIFIYALVNLLVGFLKTMDDIEVAYESNINMKWGAITWGIGIVAILVTYLFNVEYFNITFQILIASQIIPIIVISINLWNKAGLLGVLIASFTYIICSTAIVVLICPLLVILLFLVIGGIIFYIVFFKMNMPIPIQNSGGGISMPTIGNTENESQSTDNNEPEYDYVLKGKGNLGDDLLAKKINNEKLVDENNKIWLKDKNGVFVKQD